MRASMRPMAMATTDIITAAIRTITAITRRPDPAMRFSPLAALNLLLVALILAVGLPGMFADAVRLPSEVTIHEIETAQPVAVDRDEVAMGRLRLASVASN